METQKNQSTFKKDIGAIWIKQSKKGDKYLTVTVTVDGKKFDLVGFKNQFKTDGSLQPDYRLYPSEPIKQAGPISA